MTMPCPYCATRLEGEPRSVVTCRGCGLPVGLGFAPVARLVKPVRNRAREIAGMLRLVLARPRIS